MGFCAQLKSEFKHNKLQSNDVQHLAAKRDMVAKEMTPADISAAQKLARECVKKNYKDC